MNKMCRTNTQDGRSMIEMLGVLAIIGVLSVGGIAGYSKAMMKFKINKTIDQISQIAQNTRTLYARQRSYGNIGGKVVYKANLAPKEMFENGASGSYGMTHPFGGGVDIYAAGKNSSGDNKAFMINLYNVPEEACIELATQDWGSDASSGLIGISIYHSPVIQYNYQGCSGYSSSYAIACAGGSAVSIPMPIDVAVDACSNYRDIALKFY